MRSADETLEVTHLISSDIQLEPNIGSDRSWVWTVAESPWSERTLAVRFSKPDDALHFKTAFEEAQRTNAAA
ncbi:hypothetical protein B0H11DRAFT_2029352 [Mycena galericulata]|nr:hypothetical protein B0H11DRAFT_2029352 [Mycena galericulata]